MRPGALVLLLLTTAFFCPSCRRQTEEDKVLKTFDDLVRLAEKRDLEAVMTYVAADFRDFEGRDKSGLRSLVSSYLSGREGIVIHRLGSRINELGPGEFSLEADVTLSSGGAEALRRLVRISPDIYRIRIDIRGEEENRLVSYAEWASIGWADLFPESLNPLRELFPGSLIQK